MAVAYSGGRDSTALLHATVAVAADLGVEVVALHVHHGLSVHADRWLAHCAARCRRWRALGAPLDFAFRRLDGRPARGDSMEAWARRERHAALAAMAEAAGATLLLLAHHRQDQAETFLLQALRGAGPAGLAAMPRQALRDGIVWARPWLSVARGDVAGYARALRLRHVEDDSNADRRHTRNRLRLDVWPALQRMAPHADAVLADAARRADEARRCADELAAIDLAVVADGARLRLDGWRALSPARRSNALRAWIARETGRAAPAALTGRLLAELLGDAPARWRCGDRVLARYRGELHLGAATPEAETDGPLQASSLVGEGRSADGLGDPSAGFLLLPGWPGRLAVRPVAEHGFPLDRLAFLRPVARRGGERFQRVPRTPPRSLKKQFQAVGVPAWARVGPLLCDGDRLVFVPGLGIDARAWAPMGVPQVGFDWQPDEAPPRDG